MASAAGSERLAATRRSGSAEAIPNAAGTGPLGDARRENRHKAIVCVTRGGEPGLCPSNADSFLQPFGPPVLQVSSELSSWLLEQVQRGVEVQVLAHVRRTPVEAFNVTAKVAGADPALPPLVIMTPRSGWYWCASERGGGLACWLELMRVLRQAKPARDVVFVASSGHELGHLGINAFVDRRPGIVPGSVGWIHLGANIGAARNVTQSVAPSRHDIACPSIRQSPASAGQHRAVVRRPDGAPVGPGDDISRPDHRRPQAPRPGSGWGGRSRSSWGWALRVGHWQQRSVSQPVGSRSRSH